MTFTTRHNLAHRAAAIQPVRGFTMPNQSVVSSQPAAVTGAINALPINSAPVLNSPTRLNTDVVRPMNLGVANQIGAITRSFNIGIDRTWNVGSFLGVANEKSYSKFLGLEKNLSNVNFNPSAGVACLKFRTGHNKLKAGLDLKAGYGLGSFSIEGSLNAEVSLDSDGLSFSATTFDPSINPELPYAYLNLDAVGRVKLDPSLKLWYDVWLASGQTGNLLSALKTDVNVKRSLVDFDT